MAEGARASSTSRKMSLGGTSQQEVDKFLADNMIDDKAASIFMETDPDIQASVMASGDFVDARNPSAALLGRIRNAKNAAQPRGEGVDEAVIEEFIKSNGLDSRAEDALRAATGVVQQAVIDRGDLSDCRNPSSAILGRLRDARNNVGNRRDSNAPKIDVEEFITANDLDERAADSIRGCNPEVQQVVMERGDLTDCRNPSAVILARIKDAGKRGVGSRGGATAKPEEVEKFIEENTLDERAADALRSCTAQVQRIAIDRGNLQDARNPSAVILGRIRDAQNSRDMGGGQGFMDMGGKGMGKMDMMGMMNMMYMKGKGMGGKGGGMCGPSMMGGGGGGCGGGWGGMSGGGWGGGWGGDSYGGWGMGSKGSGFGGKGGGDIESFIRENDIDDRAATDLRNEGRDVQQFVMSRGGLNDARNPSAAVLGRIRDAKKGGGKGRSSPY